MIDGKHIVHRVWHQLRIAVSTNTHEIIAAELSLSMVTGAEVCSTSLSKHGEELSICLVMELMAQGIATMQYGLSEQFR